MHVYCECLLKINFSWLSGKNLFLLHLSIEFFQWGAFEFLNWIIDEKFCSQSYKYLTLLYSA